jgi:hypothetical protein
VNWPFTRGLSQATTSLKPVGSAPATPLPDSSAISVSAWPGTPPITTSAVFCPLGAWAIATRT